MRRLPRPLFEEAKKHCSFLAKLVAHILTDCDIFLNELTARSVNSEGGVITTIKNYLKVARRIAEPCYEEIRRDREAMETVLRHLDNLERKLQRLLVRYDEPHLRRRITKAIERP